MQCRDLGLTEDTQSLLEELFDTFRGHCIGERGFEHCLCLCRAAEQFAGELKTKQKIKKAKTQQESLQRQR